MKNLLKGFETPSFKAKHTKPANAKNRKLMQSINLEDRQILDVSQVALGSLIGKGGFAKVHRCEVHGQEAVAKVIDSSRLNEEMTYLLTNECTIWARLAHPSIVSFLGMCSAESSIMLLCEMMPDGALLERLEKLRKVRAPPPSELELVGQLQQIASGMKYLHSFEPPVLHRDLKSANILLAEGGSRLAIADFGLARFQANTGKKMTAETGSYRWMAPEVIRHEAYDERCDVYSYAILAWEMWTYRVPFDNMMPVEAAFAVAREAKRPPIPDEWSHLPVAEMLRACWHQTASMRPPFATVLQALNEEVVLLNQKANTPAPIDVEPGKEPDL